MKKYGEIEAFMQRIFRAGLLVLLLWGVSARAQEAAPRIIFVSERDGQREIYAVNADGTDLQNLTRDPAADVYPQWRSGGAEILFYSNRSGVWASYLMDADGANVRFIAATDTPLRAVPVPAPDGRSSAYRARVGTFWRLHVTNGDTTRLLTSPGADDGPFSWSPDSRALAFERSGEIYVTRLDGTLPPVNLTLSAAYDSQPAWSPAGTQIAYVSNWEIFLMDAADGRAPYNLTQNAAYDVAPAWSPDAQQIAFASFRDGNWEIYAMQSDGCAVRRLTNDNGWDGLPQWQPQPAAAFSPVERPATAVVTTASANLRSGPGENHPVVASAAQRACLTILAPSSDGAWLQVQYENMTVWISVSVVEIVGHLPPPR
ncbi:MAG: PD40 domain-containing protein [Chloroflexi bacterium]|nr:PD40 domain-containing protein [Chloroflexota bacterium]